MTRGGEKDFSPRKFATTLIDTAKCLRKIFVDAIYRGHTTGAILEAEHTALSIVAIQLALYLKLSIQRCLSWRYNWRYTWSWTYSAVYRGHTTGAILQAEQTALNYWIISTKIRLASSKWVSTWIKYIIVGVVKCWQHICCTNESYRSRSDPIVLSVITCSDNIFCFWWK